MFSRALLQRPCTPQAGRAEQCGGVFRSPLPRKLLCVSVLRPVGFLNSAPLPASAIRRKCTLPPQRTDPSTCRGQVAERFRPMNEWSRTAFFNRWHSHVGPHRTHMLALHAVSMPMESGVGALQRRCRAGLRLLPHALVAGNGERPSAWILPVLSHFNACVSRRTVESVARAVPLLRRPHAGLGRAEVRGSHPLDPAAAAPPHRAPDRLPFAVERSGRALVDPRPSSYTSPPLLGIWPRRIASSRLSRRWPCLPPDRNEPDAIPSDGT